MRQIFEKISSKLVDVNAILDLRAALKKQGKKVVFTNGCFDILHLGHVTYLSKAADLGDYLIIALNNDASVRAQNKGANRPINNEKARALVLASLSFVDAIVQFEEDTPLNIIQLIQPDVLVKGADYDENELNPESKKYIVGSHETRGYGGVVKTIELVPNYSTTSILEKQIKS